MSELKPCPFCGGEPMAFAETAGFTVFCKRNRCGVEGPFRKTKRGAIAAWNRRKGGE